MKKVKRGIIKEGLIVGYEIIEVTEFLINQELSKSSEERSTLWKTVSLASDEEVEKYATANQKKEWSQTKEAVVVSVAIDNSKLESLLKQVSEVKEMNDLVLSENEELKKKIAEFEANGKDEKKTKAVEAVK